jgi:hypothetical protein
VGLAELIRFLVVVKLIYPGLNPKFDMCVVFMTNYFFSGSDVPIDSKKLLMTNFVNLKIKPGQSFRGAHRGKVYVCMFIEVSTHMYMSICIYTVFFFKKMKGNFSSLHFT